MRKGSKHFLKSILKMSKSQKGRKHTEETKQKISLKNKGRKFSKEHRKHLSEAQDNRAEKNGRYIDGRSIIPNYCIDCKEEISYRAKKCGSCAMKERYKSPRNHPRFGTKASHGKKELYKNIYMRSSWEIKYAKYLDKKGIKWLYEPKAFDLGDSTYRPDFYLPEKDLYIEIKGWWRSRAKEKFGKFIRTYPKIQIKIINRQDLQELGVL